MGLLLSDLDLRLSICRADIERTGDTDGVAVINGFINRARPLVSELETQVLAGYADAGKSDSGKRGLEAELRAASEPAFDEWALGQIEPLATQHQAALAQIDAKLRPNEALVQQLAPVVLALSDDERADLYISGTDDQRLAMEAIARQLGSVPTRRSDAKGGTRVVWAPVVDLDSDQTRDFMRARRKATAPDLFAKAERLDRLRRTLDGMRRDVIAVIRSGKIR